MECSDGRVEVKITVLCTRVACNFAVNTTVPFEGTFARYVGERENLKEKQRNKRTGVQRRGKRLV